MATGNQQVKQLQTYSGKKDNTGIVAKLNELIEHISQNTTVVFELKDTVGALKTSLEFSQQELSKYKTKLNESENKVSTLEKQVKGLTTRCDRFDSDYTRLQDHLTNMEAQSRRNNLILENIPDSPDETGNELNTKFMDILDGIMKVPDVRNFQIVRFHRLGRY